MASLKVFSNNVKGLRATFKRKKIFHFLNTLNCDFFCLQETHSDKDIEKEWSDEWCGKIAFSHGATNSLGVAILYKDKHKILHTYADSKGRFVSVTIQIEDKKILLIGPASAWASWERCGSAMPTLPTCCTVESTECSGYTGGQYSA